MRHFAGKDSKKKVAVNRMKTDDSFDMYSDTLHSFEGGIVVGSTEHTESIQQRKIEPVNAYGVYRVTTKKLPPPGKAPETINICMTPEAFAGLIQA